MSKCDVLIIGAGPTGLAAALFLSDHGHKNFRIVEKNAEISPFSKAFGVNARSLSLLSVSNLTERFLENGRKLTKLNLHRHTQVLAQFNLEHVDHHFPFMCVQSQADSERLLANAIAQNGINIERGTQAVTVQQSADGPITVELDGPMGQERVTANVVLGADGARSFIRQSLGVPFEGKAYEEPWQLYDIELEIPLAGDDAHIFLLDDGGMFVVRLEANIWRVLGNSADLLGALPQGTKIGRTHWESDFQISNRVAKKFVQGSIYLAGDAAHIHSGIGARGMNLGIEDAYVFAELYHRGQLNRYDHLRRPIVQKVVGQIEQAMSVPRATTTPGRVVRQFPWIVRAAAPLVRSKVEPWILGLDHAVNLL